MSLVSQLGAEHHPSGDEIAGNSEDEREAARMLNVAARFGHEPWNAACTDMVPVPNLRVQVAGALSDFFGFSGGGGVTRRRSRRLRRDRQQTTLGVRKAPAKFQAGSATRS